MKEEAHPIHSLQYVFVDDEALLKMNQQFLEHDYFTDILTFDQRDSAKDPIEGEIYISIDRVRDNAEKLQASFDEEFHRVLVHGLLHLCGYQDHEPEDKALMRQKENSYLKKRNFQK